MGIEAIERREQRAYGLAELEHDDSASGFQNARHLSKASDGIFHVPDPERDRCDIEGSRGVGQRENVGGLETNARPGTFRLARREDEHLLAEIGPHHLARFADRTTKGDREVPRSGRAIEHTIAFARSALLNRGCAPPMMQPEGEDLVGAIVGACDRCEHRADRGSRGRSGRGRGRRNGMCFHAGEDTMPSAVDCSGAPTRPFPCV